MYRLFLSAMLLAAALFMLPACKKAFSPTPLNSDLNIAQAKKWFQQNYTDLPIVSSNSSPRLRLSRSIRWDAATHVLLAGQPAIIVPIHYLSPVYLRNASARYALYSIDQLAHLVIYLDSANRYRAELVTAIPDSSYSNRSPVFKGLVLIESWQGEPLYRLHSDGQNILINKPGYEAGTIAAGLITETCYEIDGYNYAADDPDNGESWAEDAGCVPNYYSGSPSSSIGLTAKSYLDIGGGAGSPPPSPAGLFTVLSGESPIANIVDYNKCFTNVAGTDHLYQVTVCVDQPIPGTRDPWGLSGNGISGSSAGQNPIDVGHTFLILTEISDETIVTRNVGFFPKGTVTPYSPTDPGQLNNNENHSYDISLSISVDNSQFFEILNYINQGNSFVYDLNSNNCTTFVLSALRTAGIDLPSTRGTWTNGSGNDPGDLGEDIRAMNLPDNMTRSTSLTFHPNVGKCL